MAKKPHGIIFKIIRAVLCVILAVVLLAAGMLGFLSITEYRPADRESVDIEGSAAGEVETGKEISLLTFNIGYGALGDNADFFMDGGTGVYTADEERVNKNLNGILDTVKSLNPDIVFFQEIDKSSSRSYKINEYEKFTGVLKDYCC